jgi:hypothetical protein
MKKCSLVAVFCSIIYGKGVCQRKNSYCCENPCATILNVAPKIINPINWLDAETLIFTEVGVGA